MSSKKATPNDIEPKTYTKADSEFLEGAILDELDPFRDGMAAKRMGSYLVWIREGLNDGRSGDEVLESSANKYREQWGADKVVSVGR